MKQTRYTQGEIEFDFQISWKGVIDWESRAYCLELSLQEVRLREAGKCVHYTIFRVGGRIVQESEKRCEKPNIHSKNKD